MTAEEPISAATVQFETGLQPVEILHIDTAGSQAFYAKFEPSPAEKCGCQKILLDLFDLCCRQAGGYVAANFAGDGGHAFFPARLESGNSIKAAKSFLSRLPVLSQQTATTLTGGDAERATPDFAKREFRIKAHFGMLYLTADGKCDSGASKDFDSFMKHERQLAPVVDELFITDQLRTQLGGPERGQFQLFKEPTKYGALETALYRLKTEPKSHARALIQQAIRPDEITESEWRYIRSVILGQRVNVAARNSITLGLIKAVNKENHGQLGHQILTDITIEALLDYLAIMYPSHKFHATLWRPTADRKLEKVGSYPSGGAMTPRALSLDDLRYQVIRTFNSCTPSVTQCVSFSRIDGDWVDFDESQAAPARGLQAALDLPIYRTTNPQDKHVLKEILAVLSVDADRPDFFLQDEIDQWTDDFVGFLANLALAEHIRRAGVAAA